MEVFSRQLEAQVRDSGDYCRDVVVATLEGDKTLLMPPAAP